MRYKTILVSLNEPGRIEQLLAAATQLAKRFHAHVTGLYAIPAVQLYPSVGYEAVPQVFDGNQLFYKEQEAAIRHAFEQAMVTAGVSYDFCLLNAKTPSISPEVVAAGRNADLIILSAPNSTEATGVESDFIEQVVMAAGRPVLVLPYMTDTPLSLDHVVLGWNGGREATRATYDALPLLQAAGRVHLLQAGQKKDKAVPLTAIAETLTRHSIALELASFASSAGDAGSSIIAYADQVNAGLIVMGAYGHSRLREYIFGGATLHVLNHLNRPVLMSH